ncbi:4'-phosphopantetheinyl transferase family protein [Streptomyces zaehneri]|uniref:4'-phosphopantetheinyl transferase family protein n=1 Tax=Streptomyces zaehneri TaxID=3051180 RepID=UPI0028D4FD05|nr:4'-phosphopantetheinyl transferase superfamily protein [Streptomyces sp. DSM 40713]
MTGHPVQVWWARLEDARMGLRALLDPVERVRYESTVDPGGRGRFLVGCALSRLVLGELLGLPPADVPLRRVCPRCGGPHGKVHLAPPPDGPSGTLPAYGCSVTFSVTHSGALVGVAVCRGGEVGLDVEESHGDMDIDSAARVALSDVELAALYARPAAERQPAFLRVWTRKEAVLKALGVGLGVPLRELEVSGPEQPPEVLAWPDRLATRPRVSLADTVVDGMHPAAVAVVVAGGAAGKGRGEAGGVRVTVHDGSEPLAEYDH